MPHVKYSTMFAFLADIVIIDGFIAKDRFRPNVGDYLNDEDVEHIKSKYPKVLIQSGDKIDIYCDQEFAGWFIKERVRASDRSITAHPDVLKNVTIHINN